MDKITKALPDLVKEIVGVLAADGRKELADQLREATISRVAYDETSDAANIELGEARPLNAVEQNVIGVRHGETISIGTQYDVNLDTDNFGRLSSIEILSAKRLKKALKKYGSV